MIPAYKTGIDKQKGDMGGLLKNIIIIAGIIIILASIHFASEVVLPVLFAIAFTILFLPLMRWLQGRGISDTICVAITILCFIAAICILIAFVVFSFNIFIQVLPEYSDELANDMIQTQISLAGYHLNISSLYHLAMEHIDTLIATFGPVLSGFVDAVISVALVILLTCFLIIEAPRIFTTFHQASHSMVVPHIITNLEGLIDDLMVYAVIRTKINAITGIGVGLFFYLLGIEFALLWGVLTFILSYIPYIGLILAVIPALVLGYIHLGITGVVLIVICVSIINFLAENVLFPSIAGNNLNISPFVILLSLAFWVFLLGPAASLLAVPLTLFTKLLLMNYEETRWLAMLISGK